MKEVLQSPPLIKDTDDDRDFIAVNAEYASPDVFSLREWCVSPPFKQVYGTCAQHAAAQMVWCVTARTTGRGVLISPMDLYWRTRERMGTLPYDSGSQLRCVMRALTNPGVLHYKAFPDEGVSFKKRPPSAGVRFRIPGYKRIVADQHAPSTIRSILKQQGTPILVGINFPVRHIDGGKFGRTGMLTQPMDIVEADALYGHCILVDGWVDDHLRFLNSWGAWGMDNCGGGCIHESWITSDVSCVDMWTIDMKSTDEHGLL